MVGVRCPKCGLMQMSRPTCKSCGTPLGGPEMRYDPSAGRTGRTAIPSTSVPSAPIPQPQIVPPEAFSIGESIRFGWNTMKSNFGFFALLLIIVGLICIIPGILGRLGREDLPLLSAILGIISAILQMIVGMGLIRITLKVCDGKKGSLSDLFACVPLFLKYFLGSILYGLIFLPAAILFVVMAILLPNITRTSGFVYAGLIIGLILLVVPGIIWAIKYMFFSYLIVDQELGPVEALKRSAEITQGAKWDLLLLGLLLAGINLLGALALLIGLFATVPTAMVATAFAYRKLAALREAAR